MQAVKKFFTTWLGMLAILLVYFFIRNLIGWDEAMNWSRFEELSAFGTLALFIISIYRPKTPEHKVR